VSGGRSAAVLAALYRRVKILPMFRALLELFITTVAIIVARAILNSLVKGLRSAAREYPQREQTAASGSGESGARSRPQKGPVSGSELHKDPVCGTYVAESTPFRRQAGGQTFYYCSSDCREKHALVAR
jgi:YHS domain-containing protein